MTCNEDSKALSAFLDGELSSSDVAALTKHLSVCPDCVQRLAEFSALRAALAEAVPEEEVSQDFLSRIENALDKENKTMPAKESVMKPLPVDRVTSFKQRSRWPSRRPFAAGFLSAAVAATVIFTLQPHQDKGLDLAAVRDATLRGAVSMSLPMQAAMAVPSYRLADRRVDVIAGHRARVLVFAEGGEVFTLCIWKANGEPAHGVRNADFHAMRISYWNNGTDEFWAATPDSADGLAKFVAAVRRQAI